jgi:2-polyprenyl-3-methyl-5-hydroxy-6-metoxy-1,4-benzoquinol methylase
LYLRVWVVRDYKEGIIVEQTRTYPVNHGLEDLLGVDWRQAWVELDNRRKPPDDKQTWDGRAKGFSQNAGQSSYANAFLGLLSPEPGASILDMGSGSGTLAIPLARRGSTAATHVE